MIRYTTATMRRIGLAVTMMLLAAGCTSHHKPHEPGDRVIRRIEKAQGAVAWWKRKAVQYDFTLDMEGHRLIDGKVLITPDAKKVRVEYQDKTVAVYDGEHFWAVPANGDQERMQFDVRAWPFFLAMPFKLRDPGTNVADTGELRFEGQAYESAEVSFDPLRTRLEDELFILYIDRDSRHIAAMAYTLAEKKNYADVEMSHAIVFDEFETTGGVTLPRRWYFYRWSSLYGIEGPVLGEARVSNLRFVEPAKDAFDKPKEKSPATTRSVDKVKR
jgi:hypothetical protein